MQERENGVPSVPFLAPYAVQPSSSASSQLADHFTDTDSPAPSTSFSPLPLPQQQQQYDFAQPAPYATPLGTDAHLADADTDSSYRDDPLVPPRAVGLGYPPASPDNSAALLAGGGAERNYSVGEYRAGGYNGHGRGRGSTRKKRGLIGLGVVAVVIVIATAVVLPVYFLVIKKHREAANGGSGGGGAGTSTVDGVTTGGDGSVVTMDNGETFVYRNAFGGYWVSDLTDPFNNGARPNSWTPALNESWDWGTDKIYGVNLGGWFVLEPFITPALFQPYPSAPDEWTLATLMAADGTLQSTMENHYDTFITEQDFAQIAGAGLNWVRVPIPFWAISGRTVGEPFLEGVCWKYIVRMLGWARKYGLRVNFDLHTIPGSQNGYNHSGKLGQVNFLNGIMGVANAQRAMDYIRIIVEFISQPEYVDLIPIFGIVNEALVSTIGIDQITSFYLQAHDMIRTITGFGAGHGPFISIHDGFIGVATWAGFLPGSDRIILDTHPYFAFDEQPNDAPIATSTDPASAGGTWPAQACNAWGPSINTSRTAFGVTVAGEFSNGYNDCGTFLTGVNGTQTYGGDCSLWLDSSTWNATVKAGLMQYALASMDAMQDWFFWTWKIGNATDGVVSSPLWSYQLGLAGGWMPTDPRTSAGTCAALGVDSVPFNGTFSAWQTGGTGAGTIAPTAIASFGTWPPATISNVAAAALTVMPTYTQTGSVATLTYVTPTPSGRAATVTPTVSVGDGWVDPSDTAQGVTSVAGCTYVDAWSALNAAVPTPTALCTGA
ncbi:glycoside hydrolase family 5 protein [Mycena galericulata]|nr:glycoside hydrolase family 5 protein [Mycena galericulata]